MRLLAILLTFALVGCASRNQAVTYAELESIQVSDGDCKNVDNITRVVEQQLQVKGILGSNPEDLTEADRQYNSRARVIIWSLRIGCNNPKWSQS